MRIHYPFLLPALLIVFFISCSSEKEAAENRQTETMAEPVHAMADDTSDASVNSDEVPVHPVSAWAYRNPHHPFFFSSRVDKLVNGKTPYSPNGEDAIEYIHDHLNKAEMNQLTVRELIYYCLKYPCSFSQICAGDEYIDSTDTPKVSGFMPFSASGETRSEWQSNCLAKRRDSVIVVMNDYIRQNPDDIDPEYLILLLELDAVESIPAVLETASGNNLHNYSYLISMMYEKKYPPFEQSGMYRKLYGEESWRYGSRIEATHENLDSIKRLAGQWYGEWLQK